MHKKTYFFQMDAKQVEEKTGKVIIEGYASTPDVDRYKDIVEPEAFANALKMYMKNPVLLYQHDADKPVGVIKSAKVTERGLWISAEVMDEDTKEKVGDGRMRAFSIGFIPLKTELQHEDGTPFNFEEDSVWDSDLVRVIKEVDLVEISIVTTPANGHALFTVNQAAEKFFSDVITKSIYMDKQNKEILENEENRPTEEQKPEEKPVETEEQKPSESEEEATEEAPVEEATTEEEQTKESEKGDETPESKEESENTEEEAVPATDEGAEEAATEESATEDKPADEGAEASEEEKCIIVDAKTASELHMLVKAEVIREAKEGEKAAQLPKSVVRLMSKMTETIEEQHKSITELKEKLDNTPDKKSVVLNGQFQPHVEKSVDEKNAQMSGWMKGLFEKAIRAEV